MTTGLVVTQPKRPVSIDVEGPTLLPNRRVERRVFLEPELWDELSEAADFHTHVFKKMDSKQVVSRNDLIGSFLRWALKEYWDDKGGKPSSDSERDRKAADHAERLTKQESKK